jgi:hypothetical protein
MNDVTDPLTDLPVDFVRVLAVEINPYHDALMPSQIKFLLSRKSPPASDLSRQYKERTKQ